MHLSFHNIASQSDKLNGSLLTLVIVPFHLHASSWDYTPYSIVNSTKQVIKQVWLWQQITYLHVNQTCVSKQFKMHIKYLNQRAGAGLQNKSVIHYIIHIDDKLITHQQTRKLTRMAINLASGLHTACKFSPSLCKESESLLYFPNLTLCWINRKSKTRLNPNPIHYPPKVPYIPTFQ